MWQQPKTDWRASDFFNIQDYNRIKGNLNEIRSMALELWPEFEFEDMGQDKAYQDYGFYADEINRFEDNLDHICTGTYPFEIGDKRTYSENQSFIGWEELNRIESACLKMYLNIQSGMDSRPTLEMTLGGDVNTWL